VGAFRPFSFNLFVGDGYFFLFMIDLFLTSLVVVFVGLAYQGH
jgi:hypothetical protein